AATLAIIVASEKPDDLSQKMGKKATAWVAGNIAKVVEKVGIAAAAASITNAIASYYGLA
ncbi:MAG: hypothetical protein Q7T84_01420, partial [Phenylobacterium sp.]|uniref:hypothetical protein n=1 Tax=Phenylobacterium sp. TaxID=1871053 RepID=UPI00271CB5D9